MFINIYKELTDGFIGFLMNNENIFLIKDFMYKYIPINQIFHEVVDVLYKVLKTSANDSPDIYFFSIDKNEYSLCVYANYRVSNKKVVIEMLNIVLYNSKQKVNFKDYLIKKIDMEKKKKYYSKYRVLFDYDKVPLTAARFVTMSNGWSPQPIKINRPEYYFIEIYETK